jgi:hypothetical protein
MAFTAKSDTRMRSGSKNKDSCLRAKVSHGMGAASFAGFYSGITRSGRMTGDSDLIVAALSDH